MRFLAVLIFALPAVWAGCTPTAKSQAPGKAPAVEVENLGEIYEHEIGPRPIVRTPWTDLSIRTSLNQGVWEFRITVDELGNVSEAHYDPGPSEILNNSHDQAAKAVMAMRFKPFVRQGQPVRVQFPYYVPAKPEDYSGPSDRTFPASPSLSDVTIRLMRTGCFGTCPAYEVEVRGDGQVTYSGRGFVLAEGRHTWRIPESDVVGLLDLFRRADYFQLGGYYEADVTDLPTFVTSLSIGGQRKFVLDYAGRGLGGAFASTSFGGPSPNMPPLVSEIEDAIDRLSGATSWVRGDEQTIPRLRAAGWNFRSKASGQALDLLLSDCNTAVALAFIQQGAPVNVGSTPWVDGGVPPIAEAARCGHTDLIRLMEAKGALAQTSAARLFLESAVESGFPEFVEIALRRHRNANVKDRDGKPLISSAAGSYQRDDEVHGDAHFNSAKVIELLLAAGANPNATDGDGNTPLHEVNDEAAARVLLKAGANPNAKNSDGETPLFNGYFKEPKRVLLEAGADVSVRNKSGQTALFVAQYAEVADALIKAGADVNAVDLSGRSALQSASSEEVTLSLLSAGASLPNDPKSLSELVEKAREREWRRVLQVLQAKGVFVLPRQ